MPIEELIRIYLKIKIQINYGKKYKQIINITGPNGRNADILTGWILEKKGKYRLTTIYVK